MRGEVQDLLKLYLSLSDRQKNFKHSTDDIPLMKFLKCGVVLH